MDDSDAPRRSDSDAPRRLLTSSHPFRVSLASVGQLGATHWAPCKVLDLQNQAILRRLNGGVAGAALDARDLGVLHAASEHLWQFCAATGTMPDNFRSLPRALYHLCEAVQVEGGGDPRDSASGDEESGQWTGADARKGDAPLIKDAADSRIATQQRLHTWLLRRMACICAMVGNESITEAREHAVAEILESLSSRGLSPASLAPSSLAPTSPISPISLPPHSPPLTLAWPDRLAASHRPFAVCAAVLKDAGDEALRSSRPSEARLYYRIALLHDGTDSSIHSNLSTAYRELGMSADASEAAMHAVRLAQQAQV